MVPTIHYLIVSALLLCIGLAGFVARRILVIALAAAEAAIGLAIVILIFKNAGDTAESDALSVDNYQLLKH